MKVPHITGHFGRCVGRHILQLDLLPISFKADSERVSLQQGKWKASVFDFV